MSAAVQIDGSPTLMADEYEESAGNPIKVKGKKFGTKPKTFTLPIEVESTMSWFANALGLKKSHLVSVLIEHYLREEQRKEDEKISKEIQELMDIIEASHHF